MENRITPANYPPDENDAITFLRALREKKPACAIIGFTDHRIQAFELDRSRFALFGLNEMWRYHQPKLFDCWFEIHDYDGKLENFSKPKEKGGDPEHIEAMAAMNNLGMPVFMQTHHAEIPSSVPFPKEFVEADLPDGLGLYKTSCPAWELGLAIALGFEEIHMYGIDMAQDTEYAEQRNCVEFLLGIAVGRGVKIHIPTNSDILHCWGQYAFGQEGEAIASKLKERHKWLHKEHSGYLHRIADLENEYQKKRRDLDGLFEDKSGGLDAEYKKKKNELLALRFQAEGAISDVEYLQRSWTVRARSFRGDSPTEEERKADERVNATALPADQQIHRVDAPVVVHPESGDGATPAVEVETHGP